MKYDPLGYSRGAKTPESTNKIVRFYPKKGNLNGFMFIVLCLSLINLMMNVANMSNADTKEPLKEIIVKDSVIKKNYSFSNLEKVLITKALDYKGNQHISREEMEDRVLKIKNLSLKLFKNDSILLPVIFNESKICTNIFNFKNSGAVGILQWMPATLYQYGLSSKEVSEMTFEQQLVLVEKYFNQVKYRYGNDFKYDIVNVYLSVLYPKAVNQDPDYILYASPSMSYRQNAGLDENKDKRVTVFDIKRHLKKRYNV